MLQYLATWELFLQISLQPEDRDVVRFLRFKNIKDIDCIILMKINLYS